MKNILILCTGNSCRSQIAEAYLKKLSKNKAQIFSAGTETHGVNPLAIETMKEDGIDISHHTSNLVSEYQHIDFDYVITVCDHANERCPLFFSTAKKFHQNFEDPAKIKADEVTVKNEFRRIRNEIKEYCLNFYNQNIIKAEKY